jgi:hypothetical protein
MTSLSGKTATDAIVWLRTNGVDPGDIVRETLGC